MGNSADCRFEKCRREHSAFFYHQCTHCEAIDTPIIYVEFDRGTASLSSLIHEINECELVHLLIKKFNQPKQQTIKFDKKLRRKYRKFMNMSRHGPIEESLVSHIMSPYGCCGCIFPNYKNRTRW